MPIWKQETVKFFGGQLVIRVVGESPQEQYKKILKGLSERAKNMKPVMDAWGKYMLESIDRNFKAQGRPKWTRLAPATIADRKRKGFGSGPILQRTKKLRKSFRHVSTAVNMKIYGIDYGIYHQKGGAKIPQRIIVNLQAKDRAELTKLINRWIFKGN